MNLRLPSNIDKEQVKLFYDNGRDENIVIKADFSDNQMNFSKLFYSRYATITVSYKDKSARFWISDKPSVINFADRGSTPNFLQNGKLSNAFAVDESEAQKSITEYISAETKSLNEFRAGNNQWFRKDSLILIFEEKSRNLSAKKIEFVKNNGNLYYSFWLFRRELVYADYNIDSLFKIYNNAFPISLKNSEEGKEVLKRRQAEI